MIVKGKIKEGDLIVRKNDKNIPSENNLGLVIKKTEFGCLKVYWFKEKNSGIYPELQLKKYEETIK